MQQRITPTLNTSNTFTLTFPNQIAQPIYSTNVTQSDYVVRSSNFEVDGVTCRIINETHVTAGVAKSSRKLQVVNAASGLVIVDNIGEYNSTTRQVSIVSFKPSSIIGGNDFIKISVLPANQSAISPLRNDILIYDGDESTIFPVTVTSDN